MGCDAERERERERERKRERNMFWQLIWLRHLKFKPHTALITHPEESYLLCLHPFSCFMKTRNKESYTNSSEKTLLMSERIAELPPKVNVSE
jgi:hypothetical protein